ncbi:hypothetical protein ANCCAN_28159 [Ancylostoma caninum]|uniref:Uncharacterized protein n=1 Tax=Ancylostoma caninum TaxID=29170 RepID=A0A368F1Z9_ANCCA|nr:hypothetical protein ANCCAN_28159 [Ancylostoma caninum]
MNYLSKHEAEKKEFLKIEEALRREVTLLRGEQETNKARIRELEQKNDDLERHERNNQQEINEMTEKLTLLENELAEKQTTTEEMYRLREEMRAAERPLLMVGPLRAERQDDTPEEPTPGDQQKQKPQFTSRSSASVESVKSNGVSCATRSSKDSTGNENSEVGTEHKFHQKTSHW